MTLTRSGRRIAVGVDSEIGALCGVGLAREVRALFDDVDPATLAEYLIGGVTKADLSPLTGPSLTCQALDVDDFVLAPLPDTLFQRDNAAWIGAGLTIGSMAKAARRRESVNTGTVYRYHPLFRDGGDPFHHGGDDAGHAGTGALW
jgi:arginine deiminase